MSDESFSKIGQTDEPMHGPRGLLLCGYGLPEQMAVVKLLEKIDLADVPVICVRAGNAHLSLLELLALPGQTDVGQSSGLRTAAIMSGLTEGELHRLMNAHRQIQLPPPLWATLTPNSESWSVGRLLDELSAEAEAFRAGQNRAS